MVDEDFDGFLARLRAAASAEQRQELLAHATDAIGTWSSATCVVWLGRLAADPLVGLDDVDGVSARPLGGWDEFAASAVLLEALFARAAELDVADAIGWPRTLPPMRCVGESGVRSCGCSASSACSSRKSRSYSASGTCGASSV